MGFTEKVTSERRPEEDEGMSPGIARMRCTPGSEPEPMCTSSKAEKASETRAGVHR